LDLDSELSYDITYFEGIPREWEIKTLESVLSLIKDGTHNPPKRYKNGIKFIAGATDVKYLNIDFTNCTYISESDYEKIHKFYKIQPEDILLTIVGTIGNVAIVKKSDLPFSMQRSIALLRCGDSLHYKFLFYWLTSEMFKKMLYANVNPTAQPGIYLGVLKQLKIPLPSLREQQAIAKTLSDLDEKIELNNQMNKTLENIAQAIFKRWFIDFEFPNENGEPYKSSGGEMVESELGMIPKDWGVSTIGKSLQTFLGGTPSTKNKNYWTNGSIPWINSGKVNEFRILEPTAYITEEALKNSATKIMPKKTTVIAITGATLGKVSIIEKEMCANQSVVGIIENKILPSEFIYFWVKAHMKKLMSEQTGGAQQHINKENVNSLEILIPPLQIIEKYIINVRPIFDEISNKCSENLTLSKIRDDLLPKLMTGKIRVPLEEQNV